MMKGQDYECIDGLKKASAADEQAGSVGDIRAFLEMRHSSDK